MDQPRTAAGSDADDTPPDDPLERETARLYHRLAVDPASEQLRRQVYDEVVCMHLDLARALARRFRGRGIADEDLEQVACTALVQVVHSYDVSHGEGFLAFAVPSITGTLKRHFRDRGWTVRPPRRLQDLQLRIRGAEEDLCNRLGRSPRPREIAEYLGADLGDVIESLTAHGCFSPASLDRPLGNDPDPAGPTLGDRLMSARDELAAAEARTVLRPVVARLNPRDKKILRLRFFEQRTQQEIADSIGVSQMQVSRLINRILRDLRHGIVGDEQDGVGRTDRMGSMSGRVASG
ncbi:sigma-70 family RNA polymerase sigma factor [Actinopolymorpha singaporensis]|uniref:RNA polymerase sigma-B factor n=1 Tax=Actinopolymorpha singaporensis TaxID=117157 RepID=A0A1H1TKU2_9ACTN|nr:sigma-70 family RNA polymerase sigma factor [Actinopolymorpha singaporensis]SDS60818.1 RNA polymerase sigma-B factor [Actinopolymorpha singaporensis]